ncbi:MAG: PIG-L deacetylase family protein [Bryobacteraceae bacterium]|jgi:LmbE family N-acetylglucosaminyl deacetylase
MNVTVIAPHPDDEILGCGGTIAAHCAAGDQVTVVLLTRGNPAIFPPDLIARTRQEFEQVHRMLGVREQILLDFLAPGLEEVPTYEVADQLRQIFQKTRPQIVYTPFGGDLHSDHKVAYMATLVATRPIGGFPVARVLCYETLSETEWGDVLTQNPFIPNVFHDIQGHLEKKLEAMACYKSQLRDAPHPRNLEVVRMLAGVRGAVCGLHAAEAFCLVREIVSGDRTTARA